MLIAVTSQNKKTITDHAGKCRRFYLFTVQAGAIQRSELIELTPEDSFHNSAGREHHPLQGIDVLLTRGMGDGLIRRLQSMGIEGVITQESDPETSVTLYLEGQLETLKLSNSHHHPPNNSLGSWTISKDF